MVGSVCIVLFITKKFDAVKSPMITRNNKTRVNASLLPPCSGLEHTCLTMPFPLDATVVEEAIVCTDQTMSVLGKVYALAFNCEG